MLWDLKMPKFLIFGKNGQVGWELQRSLSARGEVISLGRCDDGGDFLEPEGLASVIRHYSPDIVFNAAAYTAVDKAETERELAYQINAVAVNKIAEVCREIGSTLVHYSTDYVFDGSGNQPWLEESPTTPLNIYGKSKLAGEDAVLRSGCNALIFRTSWVYGAHGRNFLKTILRLAETKEELNVVGDQIGTPTSADFIADFSSEIAILLCNGQKNLSGIYNLVPNGITTWFDFAFWIVDQATKLDYPVRLKTEQIKKITSADYPTLAKRPLNSRLDNSKLRSLFTKPIIHDWKVYANRVLIDLSGK